MQKIKYSLEVEINASPKMLFPYLSTHSGLREWFADNVELSEDKSYLFYWDKQATKALRTSYKNNVSVKFEFIKPNELKDHAYLNILIDENELTQTSFLKITDYSEANDIQEMEFLWSNLLEKLKAVVGAH
jgi:uncharacterized protein YndB with AHSA1/START domain